MDDKEETKAEGYDCPHPSCKKTCPTQSGLKTHFGHKHPGEGWIEIDESGIVTIIHEYVCNECMQKFDIRDSYNAHIKRSKFLFMFGQKRYLMIYYIIILYYTHIIFPNRNVSESK